MVVRGPEGLPQNVRHGHGAVVQLPTLGEQEHVHVFASVKEHVLYFHYADPGSNMRITIADFFSRV